jgi:hypothetical protein
VLFGPNIASVLAVFALFALTACQRQAPVNTPATKQDSGFEDVTEKVGLNFVNHAETTNYFMPVSMGSGGAIFDFDNDGRMDIYLVRCVVPGASAKNQLYHQEADGTFKDVSSGSGLDVASYGMGVAVGDANNDGLADVLLTEYQSARLFVNRGGGKFEDASASAGIENPAWAMSASFFDYDRDGWLDLVIANYVDYIPTQQCFDMRNVPEFCGPKGFSGTVTRLFHNESAQGGLQFRDVTVRSGIVKKPGPGLGVLCADFDGDHWPDVLVADDGQPNRLFINQRDGTFKDEASIRGLAYNGLGGTAANMGIAFGDVNSDGLFDLFITHLNWEQHTFWKQDPRGIFQDQTALQGLANTGWRGTGFGTVFADFDCDGDVDLAFANGSIRRVTDASHRVAGIDSFWSSYAQRNQIFVNDGSGKFSDVSEGHPALCGHAAVGRGLACGDLNNDGAVDLLLMNAGSPARILRNACAKRGNWLVVRAIDPALGGRDAYGAEIIVEAGGQRWWRFIQPGYSYLVSSDPRAHFGMGQHAKVERVRVIWLDGTEEIFPGTSANQLVVLRKGGGSAR